MQMWEIVRVDAEFPKYEGKKIKSILVDLFWEIFYLGYSALI